MLYKPNKSRMQIEWSIFEKTEDGSWIFNIKDKYYTELFKELYPQIMKKSNTGWRLARNGKTYYSFFRDLVSNDEVQINKFIENFSKYVILGLNKNLVSYFKDELDFVIALSFNAESPTKLKKGVRTKIGQSIFLLKNRHAQLHGVIIDSHFSILKDGICDIIKYIDNGLSVKNPILTSIPFSSKKSNDLPDEIVKQVVSEMNSIYSFDNYQNLKSKLLCNKPNFKNVALVDKITLWNKIYDDGNVELSCSVKDSDVYIIDDLYQSGATMWCYAKYLKSQGARNVYGIACVKNLRDSDNK